MKSKRFLLSIKRGTGGFRDIVSERSWAIAITALKIFANAIISPDILEKVARRHL